MRWFTAFLTLLAWLGVTLAQSLPGFPPGAFSNQAAHAPAGVSYTGPGDVVSGATVWYGLRAYNAAYATGSNKAINYRRASDNTTQDGVILTTGAFDIASANTFAGTDATCTGTITSTTLTCSGASSTPHAGSTLTGTGIIQPSYIVSCGTFTGGAGTCTLNASQTISVGETITMQYGLYVTGLYDQSGNARHATQSTAAQQPQLLPLCLNSLPCMSFVATSSQGFATASITLSQPISVSHVGRKTSGSNETILSNTAQNSAFGYAYSSANTASLYGGAVAQQNATDGVWHAIQYVLNGVSSLVNVDGTAGTTGSGGGNGWASVISLYNAAGANYYSGYSSELGVWAVALNTTQQTNLCHNEYAYWGTPTSC